MTNNNSILIASHERKLDAGLPCTIYFLLCIIFALFPLTTGAEKPAPPADDEDKPSVSQAFRERIIHAHQVSLDILAVKPSKAELERQRKAVQALDDIMKKRLDGQKPIFRPLKTGEEYIDVMNQCGDIAEVGKANKKEKDAKVFIYRMLAGWMIQGKRLLESEREKDREKARLIFGGMTEVLLGQLDDGEVAAKMAHAFLLQCVLAPEEAVDATRRNRRTLQWCRMSFGWDNDIDGKLVTAMLSSQLGPFRNWRDSARIDLIELCMKHECWAEALVMLNQVAADKSLGRVYDLEPKLTKNAAAVPSEEASSELAKKTQEILNTLRED